MMPPPWLLRKLTKMSFGSATQRASPKSDPFLSWWHIPISVNSRAANLRDCQVWLRMLREPDRRMVWSGDSGPSLEKTLRFGDQPQVVPVVARAEHDYSITADLLRLPHLPLPTGVARVTDVQAIYHRQNFLDLPPGEHHLCLVVRYGQFEFLSPIYRLQVPNPTVGNGHFILTRTE